MEIQVFNKSSMRGRGLTHSAVRFSKSGSIAFRLRPEHPASIRNGGMGPQTVSFYLQNLGEDGKMLLVEFDHGDGIPLRLLEKTGELVCSCAALTKTLFEKTERHRLAEVAAEKNASGAKGVPAYCVLTYMG